MASDVLGTLLLVLLPFLFGCNVESDPVISQAIPVRSVSIDALEPPPPISDEATHQVEFNKECVSIFWDVPALQLNNRMRHSSKIYDL